MTDDPTLWAIAGSATDATLLAFTGPTPNGPTLLTTADLQAQGHTSRSLARLVGSGDLVRVARGLYSPEPGVSPGLLHHSLVTRRLTGLPPTVRADAVVSHWSAAVLHGLQVPDEYLERLWITRPGRGGGHDRRGLHELRAGLPPEEVCHVAGVRVTTAARTAVDLARRAGFVAGVQVMDQVLTKGTARRELLACLDRGARRPGNETARRAVRYGVAGQHTVFESALRASMVSAQVPRPLLRHDPTDQDGEPLGTVPFLWPELGLVGMCQEPGSTLVTGMANRRSATDIQRRIAQLSAQGWWTLLLTEEHLDLPTLRKDFRAAARIAALVRRAAA